MILTVTLNAAIDRTVAVRNFRLRYHLGLDDGAGLEVEEAAQRSG